MKRRNTMTAAVFLLAVAAGFLLLATSFFGGEGKFEALLKTFLRERDVMAFVDGAETAVNGDLDRDHLFIQLYGGVQRLSGRRVVEDAVGENTVVRLSTGGLNFVDLQAAPGVGPQVAENAAATAAFAQSLEALGIPYLYVNAPTEAPAWGGAAPDRGGGVRQRERRRVPGGAGAAGNGLCGSAPPV